eukprot:16186302-Heterocapsa_arctica.AAC.1
MGLRLQLQPGVHLGLIQLDVADVHRPAVGPDERTLISTGGVGVGPTRDAAAAVGMCQERFTGGGQGAALGPLGAAQAPRPQHYGVGVAHDCRGGGGGGGGRFSTVPMLQQRQHT